MACRFGRESATFIKSRWAPILRGAKLTVRGRAWGFHKLPHAVDEFKRLCEMNPTVRAG